MNIQEMVDARIEELRNNQQNRTSTSVRTQAADKEQILDFRKELVNLGDLADKVFSEIAGRVLEITEQVSRDCVKWEKDILSARLMLLESAESVLDQALSLKRQIRKTIEGGAESRQRTGGSFRQDGAKPDWRRPELQPARTRKRANMMANGVSDLFRNTHR